MTKTNPYTLVFGREPAQVISRVVPLQTITDAFTAEHPSQQLYIITGVRGAGKTVLMTEAAKQISQREDWVSVELNPQRDMLTTLASKLNSEHRLARLFQDAKINLSFFGFGMEIEGSTPITDIEVALSRMISSLHKHGKRLLITVDEVSNTREMQIFASAFQILIRQDLPVFLLMTGLYENVNSLQNEKNLTFLYRAPKIELGPLNIGTIAENYRTNLKCNDRESLNMARLTKGYSFAFQVLGHFAWEQKGFDREVEMKYKQYLDDYVYEKIWMELTAKEKEIAHAIAATEGGKISDIRRRLGIETNQFNPYRKRLIKKGIINGETYGHVYFTLPLFERFVEENYM